MKNVFIIDDIYLITYKQVIVDRTEHNIPEDKEAKVKSINVIYVKNSMS